MRKVMTIMAIVFTLLTYMSSSQAKPTIGANAPHFNLPNAKGELISLSDFKGKTVVLEWTNHQCPYVKKHYRSNNMQMLQKKFTDQGVIWLSIISSAEGKQGYIDGATAEELTTIRNAFPTHVLFDPEGNVGRSYDARTTPHMYVIDANGTLRYMGGIDSIPSADREDIKNATNYVDVVVPEILNQKTNLSYNVTQPYGCSVKYQ